MKEQIRSKDFRIFNKDFGDSIPVSDRKKQRWAITGTCINGKVRLLALNINVCF